MILHNHSKLNAVSHVVQVLLYLFLCTDRHDLSFTGARAKGTDEPRGALPSCSLDKPVVGWPCRGGCQAGLVPAPSGESGLGKVQKNQTEIGLSIALFMLQHLNVENKVILEPGKY